MDAFADAVGDGEADAYSDHPGGTAVREHCRQGRRGTAQAAEARPLPKRPADEVTAIAGRYHECGADYNITATPKTWDDVTKDITTPPRPRLIPPARAGSGTAWSGTPATTAPRSRNT